MQCIQILCFGLGIFLGIFLLLYIFIVAASIFNDYISHWFMTSNNVLWKSAIANVINLKFLIYDEVQHNGVYNILLMQTDIKHNPLSGILYMFICVEHHRLLITSH